MQKAHRHPALRHGAPIACRRVVSGSLSSPGRGSSHRSLALLGFAIGRQGVLSLAGWAPRIRAGFHVSGPTQGLDGRPPPDAYGTITLYGRTFQNASAGRRLGNSHVSALQPPPDESGGFGLGPRSLAATDGVAFAFLSSGY